MKRHYLTLPEVVVLLAILALLIAGFVFPILSKSTRPKPHRRCDGNLRMIGLALLMYSGDFDGAFPSSNSDHFEPLASLNYIQNGKVWACPSRSQVLTLASDSAYIYLGSGLMDDNDHATEISLAYDEFMNHPGNEWMNVLFIDGHVQGAKPGTKPWAQNAP